MSTEVEAMEALLAARPNAGAAPSSVEAMASAWSSFWTKACRAHPGWLEEGDAVALAQYVGARLLPNADPARALDELHAGDLTVAFCAGVKGAPAEALRALDAEVRQHGTAALQRVGLSADTVEDTLQLLRTRLWVAEPSRPAKILEYSGRGALQAWLRAVATGMGLNALRRARPEREQAQSLGSVVVPEDAGLELGYLRVRHRDAFKRALGASLKSLRQRDRNLLRLRFQQGLTGEELGKLYRVHPTTAMRWIERAQEQILDATRAQLREELQLSGSEIDSLIRDLQSGLELSLREILAGRT
jgi:RNA polymerase sigma-70 factor (ECF subfamily)